MAIINSSSYRLLNSNTVINILNSRSVQTPKYPHIRSNYYDLKKTSINNILVIVKSQYSSNIEKIYDNITQLFSIDVLLSGKNVFTTGRTSNVLGIDFILTLQRGVNKVELFFKSQKTFRPKVPELLKPGILNEEYFVSKINDQVEKIKEAKDIINLPNIFEPNLNLVLYEKNVEKYTIPGINFIKRVGQELEKQDVVIKTKNNKTIGISLKKENFSFWSSASKYSAAKNIIDYLVNSNLISVSNVSGRGTLTDNQSGKPILGIRLKATVGEIKKYCFGGEESKIDYILIKSFNFGDFKDIRKVGGGQDYKLELDSELIYRNTSNDIIRMRDDVYFTIVPSSKNSSALMPKYPGFRIQFSNAKSSRGYYEPKTINVSLGRI